MNIRKNAIAIAVSLLLVLTIGSIARGAQSEADAIGGAIQGFLSDWNDAFEAQEPLPDTAATEAVLSGLWMDTASGSECETFAGVSMGIVALMGLYNTTDDAAYLGGTLLMLEALDGIEYACLIEA